MIRTTAILLAVTAALACLAGCPDEQDWEQISEDGDCFDVVISPEEGDDDSADDDDSAGQAEDEDEIDLHSRAGFFDIDVVGTATLSPTRGPAGTRFTLVVVLVDTGTDQGNPVDAVDRVTARVDNGSITLDEFALDESPADERRWSTALEAGGVPESTRRTDRICVALYTEI